MKQLTIFKFLRDPNDHFKILGKVALRTLNVHPTFEGIGTKGEINREEFKRLAHDLEPSCDSFDVH